MASTRLVPTIGQYPKRGVLKKRLQSRSQGYGYHRTGGFAFYPGDPEFKVKSKFMH